MTISRAVRWAAKHQFFINDFNTIWSACQGERRQAVADRRFYSITGAQFEDELGEQFEETPRFECNKTHQAVIRIFNEYRNNRISVMYRPNDEDSSSETAETLTGRYRADEQKSNAQEAYDNAFEEGVGGGMGAFRYRAVADDDEDADEYGEGDDDEGIGEYALRVAIEPIFDADSSVFYDLDAKRQDKADAVRCYVITSVSRAAYESDPKYKNFSVATWPKPTVSTYFDWCTPDVVYLAEVFEIEKKGVTYHIYKSTITEDENELRLTDAEVADEARMADLKATGYIHARDERAKRRKVRKWLMNGAEIMEDEGYIPGRCIPVVPTYGKRWFVDNIERFMGQVRLSKDMQRLLNMMISRLAEINSTTPYEVPILTPQQVAGHTVSWAEGNRKRHPYRLINAIENADGSKIPAGPLGTVKPPDVPPALAALTQVANMALDELGGGGAAQEQDVAANISGKAVELIQKRLDMQSFIYTDNFAKAMKRGGEVWLSMQKDIMSKEEHSAPIIKSDGTQDFVKMNTPGLAADGRTTTINDPRKGKYGVVADVGPSFNSRRDATVRALLGLLQTLAVTDPQTASVLAATAVMNMDGEGLEDLRKFFRRKLVQSGAVTPTEEEKKELAEAAASQPPDANNIFLLAEAKKAEALGNKAHADALYSLVNARKAAAETKKIEEETHATSVDTTLAVHAASIAPPVVTAPQAAPAPALA